MTNYYEETIEQITEQTIEKEIREDIEEIKTDAVDTIEEIKQDAVNQIDAIELYAIGEDGNGGEVNRIKSETLAYIDEKKTELADFGNISKATAEGLYEDICGINDDTDVIAEDTIVKIKANIRQMMVDNGYVIKIECDENGNADMVLVKEMV